MHENFLVRIINLGEVSFIKLGKINLNTILILLGIGIGRGRGTIRKKVFDWELGSGSESRTSKLGDQD